MSAYRGTVIHLALWRTWQQPPSAFVEVTEQAEPGFLRAARGRRLRSNGCKGKMFSSLVWLSKSMAREVVQASSVEVIKHQLGEALSSVV